MSIYSGISHYRITNIILQIQDNIQCNMCHKPTTPPLYNICLPHHWSVCSTVGPFVPPHHCLCAEQLVHLSCLTIELCAEQFAHLSCLTSDLCAQQWAHFSASPLICVLNSWPIYLPHHWSVCSTVGPFICLTIDLCAEQLAHFVQAKLNLMEKNKN